jgi:hypothetical protein
VRLSIILALALFSVPALAQGRAATFALIIGVNESVDRDLAPLKYADDDAAGYFSLFRLLGTRTYLLTRLDENTRRLQPQAAAEAREPIRKELDAMVSLLASDVDRARERHVETAVYFVYAGHGNVADGEGYITLEDARLTGRDLQEQIVARVHADRIHFIVDACYSAFLAYSRGPGGDRRPLQGFSEMSALTSDDRVGLLLSTSSARESHEWDAFQAGVFSHEVRSGLMGAADADGDGQVSYREIAAFVERANAAIPNDRFRPDVHARPPKDSEMLLDIRPGLKRRLEIKDPFGAHYLLEDNQGVRLADFHNAPGAKIELLRPHASGLLYLRRLSDDREFAIGMQPDVVALADLHAQEPRARARGAAHEAFDLIFSLPFTLEMVSRYRYQPLPAFVEVKDVRPISGRRVAGGVTLALGVLALGGGYLASLKATQIQQSDTSGASQQRIADLNSQIRNYNFTAGSLYSAGGAAAVVGFLLAIWPESQVTPVAGLGGNGVGIAGRF